MSVKIDWNKVEDGYSIMQTLKKENKRLKDQLQQKENIIKELREYIEKASYFQGNKVLNEKDILEILDKENKQ